MTKEVIKEYTLRISQANRSGIVAIIYELAENYINDALLEYEKDNIDSFKSNIVNAQRCISDINDAFDASKELTEKFYSIHSYIIKELAMGMILRKLDKLDEIKKMIIKLKDTFNEVSKKDTDGPMITNSQSVYAGLTYGKNSLNENIAGDMNRGFRV